MTPSCRSSRRRSSGRWRRSTEILLKNGKMTQNCKKNIWKKIRSLEENIGFRREFHRRGKRKKVERWKERRVTEGRLRRVGRSSSFKEVVSFTEHLDIRVTPGSNPQYSEKKLGQMKPERRKRNINYFTCLVSTVDIRGALSKSDV